MRNKDTFLYFNFKSTNQSTEPMQFKDPLNIITTNKIDEVIPCLQAIQKAVNNGYYAAGYFAYEAAPAFNGLLAVHETNDIPLVWFGIFEEPIKAEHDAHADFSCSSWEPNVSKPTYYKAIDQVHNHIKQGDTEQVNYTIRMQSTFNGDPFSFFKQMEEGQSANYAAYLNIGSHTIMSASPELFFQLEDNVITTKPMKGTVERGKTYEEDKQFAQWLYHSPKNRTENELITTLIREELEKLARPGTVETTKKFEIEKYPTLYQMTSTVSATVSPDYDMVDIFKVLFPAGSITGSPKQKTMDIIHDLETEPREVYCGAIGYFTPDHDALFSVPIRTVLLDNETHSLEYGVGGGITIDSDKEEEYQEVLTKAKLLTRQRTPFELLETMGLIDGQWLVKDLHLKRLKDSAEYFDFTLPLEAIEEKLTNLKQTHPTGNFRVRLVVSRDGTFDTTIQSFSPNNDKRLIRLADHPIDKNNIFFYHKTTHRSIYEEHQSDDSTYFDTLLFNDSGELTEFTTGNLVVNLDGKLLTPPVSSGLLPGTYREKLLKDGKITEQRLTKSDLDHAKDIWFINSVREWIPVTF